MPNKTDANAAADLTADGALFAQLHTADPTDAGTAGASVALPGRVAVSMGAAAARKRQNTAAVTWTVKATAAEVISHVSLWTAATGGTCQWYGPLSAPVPVGVNESFTFPPGSLTTQEN